MVITYYVMAGITFITLVTAFGKDKSTTIGSEAVLFIFIATLLCPVTLPCIIFSKAKRLSNRQQTQRYGFRSSYSQDRNHKSVSTIQ